MRRRTLLFLLLLTLCFYGGPASTPLSAQPAALTVAVAGITVAKVLDLLEAKVSAIIGRAAEAASLTADAAARNAQLTLGAVRQDLNNDLNTQWDKLELQKLSLLQQVDQAIDTLEKNVGRVERLEELSTLDISSLIGSLPFTKTVYAVKRVEGAAQMFKEDGYYRMLVRSNGFDFAGRGHVLRCNEKPLKPEWLKQARQFELEITIPASEFCGTFENRRVSHAVLDMSMEVPNRNSVLEFRKAKTRWAYFKVSIDLFPKYPVEYRLEERQQIDSVDKEKTEWQPSQILTVGGCGKDQCYAYYNVYAYLPTGAEATGMVRECTDTFNGWGSFIKPDAKTVTVMGMKLRVPQEGYCGASTQEVPAITVAGTTIGMMYMQHSHNMTRNVQFKAGYHPPIKRQRGAGVELHDITIGAPRTVATTSEALRAIQEVIVTMPDMVGSAAGGSAMKQIKSGFLQFNRTYEAKLSPNMVGYTLVAKLFTGDNIVVSESKNDPRIEVKFTNETTFKRLLVTPKAPW
jgi:hypothetical protein